MDNQYSPNQRPINEPTNYMPYSSAYEMRQMAKNSHPLSSPTNQPKLIPASSPATYGRLTKENLKKFEEEQEERSAQQKKSTTPIIPNQSQFVKSIESRQQQQQQVFVLDRIEDVDELKEDQKYKCCCRCTSVYRGAWLVGFMEALIGLIALVVVIVNYVRLGRNYLNHFVAVVCICVCYMVVLAFHFCGLQGRTACMLIPNILAQLITMILFIVTSILIGSNLTADDQSPLVILAGWGPMYGDLAKEAGLSLLTVGSVLVGACILAFLFYVWFFYICIMCYRFLNEQKRRRRGLVYNETNGSVGKIISTSTTPIPGQTGR